MQGSEDRSSHHLSFGQKKRVAVATVLSMRPEILVLDEPTSNLDPKSRRRLVDILRGLPATKIVVTHDLPLASELCERDGHPRPRAGGGRRPDREILSDAALLAAHDLELPHGFVPPAAPAPPTGARSQRAGLAPSGRPTGGRGTSSGMTTHRMR